VYLKGERFKKCIFALYINLQLMELILLIVCAFLLLIVLFILLTKGKNREEIDRIETSLKEQNSRLESIIRELNLRVETVIREQSYENRDELGKTIREFRTELTTTLNTSMQQMQDSLHKNMITGNELQREKFEAMGKTQEALIQSTEKRLDDMRVMVEEKLQKTLNERIGQSFEIVRTQLENVQKGLGEMKSLAQDVGGLKKVLTNVKMRGTFGEVQLGALLEQMMSPEQYDANVKTKKSATEFVEYAIKLPGKDDANNTVYMPIDAKFPKDVYEQYYDAFEAGDAALIDSSSKHWKSQ
jgi:Uncharacterized protein conserved in bacteria